MKLKSKVVAGMLAAAIAMSSSVSAASATGSSAALNGLKGAPVATDVVEIKGRGARNVAIGVLGAAAALAIISEAAKADERRRYRQERRVYGRGDSCSALMRRCDRGDNWACNRWDNRCHDY